MISQPSRAFIIGAIALLTLLAASLRFYRLDNQSLWTDEVASIEAARKPTFEELAKEARGNNCPPTFFLALRCIIGKSNEHIEIKARLLSVISGALSVPLFIGLVWSWLRRWDVALLAGLLLAVNPLHLWYSQETRAYALMLLFGLAAMFAFERGRARDRGMRHWIWQALYFACAVASVAIHKTGLTFALTCALWQGFDVLRRQRKFPTMWIHGMVLVAAFVFLNVKSNPPGDEYSRPSSILEIAYTGMTFIGGYSFGPSLTEIQTLGPVRAVSRHLIQTGILGAVLLLLAAVYAWQMRAWFAGRKNSGTRITGCGMEVFPSLLLLMGVGIVAVGALVSHFPYNVRYALPGLMGFLALVAAMTKGGLQISGSKLQGDSKLQDSNAEEAKGVSGTQATRAECSRAWSSPGLWAFTAVLIVSIWADAQWYFGFNYRKGDSRAVAQWLVSHQDQVKSWTVLPDYLGASIQWYLEPHPEMLSRYLPPKDSRTTSFPPTPDALILGRRHHLQQPDEIVKSYKTAATNVETVRSIAGFEVFQRTK